MFPAEAFAKSSILFMPSFSRCDSVFLSMPSIVSSSFLVEGWCSIELRLGIEIGAIGWFGIGVGDITVGVGVVYSFLPSARYASLMWGSFGSAFFFFTIYITPILRILIKQICVHIAFNNFLRIWISSLKKEKRLRESLKRTRLPHSTCN